MKYHLKPCLFLLACAVSLCFAAPKLPVSSRLTNQTGTLSPVLSNSAVPFHISIQQADFSLPVGFHSGLVGVYKGLWVFIAGRINGLHGFGSSNNFPADQQNTSIYVVNPATGVTASRALTDPQSGLTQKQIDTLTVTSPQGYQEVNTLFMSGGYGVDTETGDFETKPVLSALYLPGIVEWVVNPSNSHNSVASNLVQIYHPAFQITGGEMYKVGNVTQLIFGQNFTGQYTPGSNGDYSQQIRRFQIKNNGKQLTVDFLATTPATPDINFRRRDLNILPSLLNVNNQLRFGLIAYAGVFTLTGGVWTVPVVINEWGEPTMADPSSPATFKQAMNQYVCAAVSLYSRRYTSMFHVFLGGISYGFFSGGTFQTDAEVPFINQVTTIRMDKNGQFSQYLMDGEYPTILSTNSNPGNALLFGAGAYFIANPLSQYPNGVINLDTIRKPTVIGYIVGGIQSTLPNTNTTTDSAASPYIFKVTLSPTLPAFAKTEESHLA